MNYLLPKLTNTNRVMGLFVLFLCLAFTSANAQEVVSGTITDVDGEALIGVTVISQGTTTGTITDYDGTFSIKAASNAVLEISYIGYETLTVPVNGQTNLDITLGENAEILDEVVVVGYGSVKKSDVTGSVSSVKAEEISAFPLLNAGQALQGRAAGVVVQTQNGGEPGADISIQVRGNTSLNASSDPLVVVDGFVGAAFPSQYDIASIEILKDASATAIYGSRGSGGVILVTTKQGRTGKATVELNSNYSTQETNNRLDLLDANGFAAYQNMIRTNTGNTPYAQGSANTDWQDEIYRRGSTQNHQLSVSGGGEKINYYVSGTYFAQDGIIINSDFERLQFLANIDAQVNDKLKIGLNSVSSRNTQNGVSTQSSGSDPIGSVNGGGDDVVSLAFRFAPDVGLFDADGNFSQNRVGDDIENPFAVASEITNETKTDNTRNNAYADIEIIEGLNFRTNIGFRTQNSFEGYFKPQTFNRSTGGAFIESIERTNVLTENYLTYKKAVGAGDLTATAGYSYQQNTTRAVEAGARELLTDAFSFFNLEAGQIDQRTVDSRFSETEIESFFGRVNYDWANKYLITATVRRDGASNFAVNNKHAIFPSAAIGWKISNEKFLLDNRVLSNLKLRASYGLTGNQAIGPYQSLATFRVQPPSEVGGEFGVDLASEGNPDLKWETSFQTNIGIDVGLFENRITLSADYYHIDTDDLLAVDRTFNFYSGASDLDVLRNIGSINNSGVELSLTSNNINKNDFRWITNFNIARNRNKLVELSGGTELIGSGAPGYFSVNSTYIIREGEALGLFYGLDYQGVYQGGDIPEGTALEGRSFEDGNPIPGEPLFLDVPDEEGVRDGVIDDNDRKIIGDPNPDFTFGLTNTFTYKNFDVNIFFQGSVGGDIFNLTAVQLFNGDSNGLTDVLNSWTPENTDTDIPRAVVRGRERSSRFVESGSYVRLKNVALGYSLPTNNLMQRAGIGSIRLSLSAQNLLTFTDYSGLDPEVSYFGSGGESRGEANVIQGHDFGNYPNLRSVTFALNLKF